MAQRSKELDVFGAPWQIITEYWTENYLNCIQLWYGKKIGTCQLNLSMTTSVTPFDLLLRYTPCVDFTSSAICDRWFWITRGIGQSDCGLWLLCLVQLV